MKRRQTKKELSKALVAAKKLTPQAALDVLSEMLNERGEVMGFITSSQENWPHYELNTGGHDSVVLVVSTVRRK